MRVTLGLVYLLLCPCGANWRKWCRVVVAEAPAGDECHGQPRGTAVASGDAVARAARPRASGSGGRAGLGAEQRPWARRPREVHAATTAARRRCSRSCPWWSSRTSARAAWSGSGPWPKSAPSGPRPKPMWLCASPVGACSWSPTFHYDPVWWNTQAGYTSGWDELLWAQDKRETFQHTGLVLVEAHLQRARVDPRYKFVLAEVDYLKPFWDLYPDRRAEMRGSSRGRAVGNCRRYVQRAQHQPDGRGDGHSRRCLRHRLPTRRHGRRPPQRLATGRVRARPPVPRHHGRLRAGLGGVGAGAVPPVGAAPPHRVDLVDAVPVRVRMGAPQTGAAFLRATCRTTIRPAGSSSGQLRWKARCGGLTSCSATWPTWPPPR